MSEHALFSEGLQEVVESFVVETQELLEELNEDLLQLEAAADPALLVDKIFRAVHTVKGTSSFLGLDQLNNLAHHFEDVLNSLRKGTQDFQPEMMDVLFAASDLMAALLQQVVERDIRPVALDPVVTGLRGLIDEGPSGDGSAQDAEVPRRLVDRPGRRPTGGPVAIRSTRRSGSVRVEIDHLDNLIELVGQLTASRSALTRLLDDLKTTYGPIPQVRELHESSHRIDELAGEIRSVVLAARMVPVERVFGKFPRVARDLGRSLNKDIQIETRGADTLIDRSVADEIGEALLHLVRNAIDHGIEPRADRAKRDKALHGTILLEARQIDQRIEISVQDDGRGLDPEAIRRRAIEVGLIRANDVLSEQNLFALIWEPGFSTTDVVNQISGRGVGMDVVHTTVQRLNGSIDVKSSYGEGARFTLSLPLTVSMLRCLIVEIGGKTMALPQAAVEEVFSLTTAQRLSHVVVRSGRTVHVLDPDVVDVIQPPRTEDGIAAILVQDGKRCALMLDRLMGQEEVVHHPGSAGSGTPVVMSTVVLCDGRSIPVLDPAELVALASRLEADS